MPSLMQLLLSLDFWLGALAMLALLVVGALVFLVADSCRATKRRNVRVSSPRTRPRSLVQLRTASRVAKRVATNVAGTAAVAAFWLLLAATALAPQP